MNAPKSLLGKRVNKVFGSGCTHTGIVIAEFKTLADEPRIVLEFDCPVEGMLHIYHPNQVRIDNEPR